MAVKKAVSKAPKVKQGTKVGVNPKVAVAPASFKKGGAKKK